MLTKAYGLKMRATSSRYKPYIYLPSIDRSRRGVMQKMRAIWFRPFQYEGKRAFDPKKDEKEFQKYLRGVEARVVPLNILEVPE